MTLSELTVDLNIKMQELYEATCEYVKEHQGEKGYIDTQDDCNDYIYAMHHNDMDEAFYEHRVRAVRYNEKTELLQVVCENISFRESYQPEDFELTEEDIRNAEWFDLDSWGEILYAETLWSIAESIEEYVE